MTRYERLRKDALKSCRERGHTMRFLHKKVSVLHYGLGLHNVGVWECKHCEAWMMVDDCPAPNGNVIGGSGVSMNCTKEK